MQQLYDIDNTPMRSVDVDLPVFEDSVLSHGIAPILNKIHQWSMMTKHPVWDVMLVNVSTMIRNCLRVDRDVMSQVRRDMDVLTHYMAAYSAVDHRPPSIPKLIFYYPMYRVPKEYVLPPNKQYTEILKIEIKHYPRVVPHTEPYGVLQVHHLPVGRSRLPHLDLVNYLTKIHPTYRYSRICMLSGMPVDYHLSRYTSDFEVLRSHTADLMPKSEFGEAIFKHPVPFNPYTHLVLGDKKLIKNSTSVKSKRVLLAMAEQYKWKFQPEHVIKTQLINSGITTKAFLSGLLF